MTKLLYCVLSLIGLAILGFGLHLIITVQSANQMVTAILVVSIGGFTFLVGQIMPIKSEPRE